MSFTALCVVGYALVTLLAGAAPISAISDGQGQAEFRMKKKPVVGGKCKGDMVFTVGQDGIADGGAIKFYTPQDAWDKPKLSADHIRLKTSSSAKPAMSIDSRTIYGWIVTIKIQGGSLRPGDQIIYTYDTTRVQRYTENGLLCKVESDVNGAGKFLQIPDEVSPRIDIVSGPPARLRVVAPTVARPDQEIRVRALVMDDNNNPADKEYTKQIKVGFLGKESERAFSGNRSEFTIRTPKEPGIYHLHGIAQGLHDVYLPVKVTENPKLNIYWGQLHGHTTLSDGIGTIEEYYTYGRDIGFLDVCAANDHAKPMAVNKTWTKNLKAVRDFYDPGRYVTLAGYEWTVSGHRNVYFADSTDDLPIHHREEIGANTHPEFLAKLKASGKEVILGYHTGHPVDLNNYDPDFERLDEIHSMWGTSEYPGNPGWTKYGDEFVPQSCGQAALAMGHKLGFVAGGDSHHARPGRCWWGMRSDIMAHKEGIAAMISPKLERRDIFDALRNRHCYGSTGERILALLEINGAAMGEEMETSGPVKIHIEAAGTDILHRVTLIRDNFVIWEDMLDVMSYTHDLIDENVSPGRRWYYLRVTQQSGDRAWTSPIWVTKK
ncbi:MAG: DUF3604 domain-containing protein [Armatimonadota bacterium]|nr:DUF3604 domain-containing protein [Armatimonadota bacterium]